MISSNGHSVLIDTGTPDSAIDLCTKLKNYGTDSIDAVFLSHFHNDHTGGFEALVNRMNVSNLIFPDMLRSDSVTGDINEAKRKVLDKGGSLYTAKQGMNVNAGDFTITVLGYFRNLEDENNRSVFLMAQIGEIRFLFTGDAEFEAEAMLLNEGLDLKCDVLKVGHHGSATSTSKDFLDACKPDYAVISCGAGNIHSHPHDEALARLERAGAQIYRTDISGDITFWVTENKINITTETK